MVSHDTNAKSLGITTSNFDKNSHSVHSERRRIYVGAQGHLLRSTP